MPTQVLMPQLGESVMEGTVTEWLVTEGQPVTKDAPLLQLSTDKIETELPAPVSGILRQILVGERQTVAKGAVLAVIEEEMTGVRDQGSGVSSQGVAATPVAQRMAEARGVNLAAVRGTGPAGRVTREDVEAHLANAGFISPAVGQLAAEHRVDLAQVAGTGEGGRITKKDVLAFIAARPVAQSAGLPPAATPRVASQESDIPVPLSPMRRAIAQHMTRSLQTAPQVTTIMEADLSRVVAGRERLKDEFARQGVHLTFTPFFIQAIVAGVRAVPEANSTFRDDALLIHRQIHIGVAVALPDGLIVPVIRDADRLSLLGAGAGGERSGGARPARPVDARRSAGRHLHADQPRHVGQPARHADPRLRAGRHSGGRRDPEAAGRHQPRPLAAARRRRRHRHPPHGLSELHIRSPRARWTGRGSVLGDSQGIPGKPPGMIE
jgi:2-oxoglutarate dehydrogenase E2 component (dihydrolipoamide succinyltransferase)